MPTLTVTNTNDSGPGSLRQAIADAGFGDTIIFDLPLPATITLTSGQLVVSNNLTIEGPGPEQLTISGGQNSRVFVTISVNTIRALTVTEGLADYGGGIALTQGGVLTLENVHLVNNRATGELDSGGGAIYAAFNAAISITNCVIAGNDAEPRGGALLVTTGSQVLVRNSTVEDNRAVLLEEEGVSPEGGAIFIDDTSSVRIENSTLRRNRTVHSSGLPGAGGAIFTTGSLTITRSTLTLNSSRTAGAVDQRGGTFTTVNSTYSGNNGFGSGAIQVFAGDCRVSFCTLAENVSTFVGGLSVNAPGGATVKNSLLANNVGISGNCSGPMATLGVNMGTDATCAGFTQVSTFDLNLQPLALNPPGTTETHALGAGSVAINAAPDCTDVAGIPVTTDQRGVTRPQGTACDIGAYEFQFLKNMNPPA